MRDPDEVLPACAGAAAGEPQVRPDDLDGVLGRYPAGHVTRLLGFVGGDRQPGQASTERVLQFGDRAGFLQWVVGGDRRVEPVVERPHRRRVEDGDVAISRVSWMLVHVFDYPMNQTVAQHFSRLHVFHIPPR